MHENLKQSSYNKSTLDLSIFLTVLLSHLSIRPLEIFLKSHTLIVYILASFAEKIIWLL